MAEYLASTTSPTEVGRLVIGAGGFADDLNIGPPVSPDGKWVAFLSTRSLFAIDLFVANASDGQIVRRLTSNATDRTSPAFSSSPRRARGTRPASALRSATVVSGRAALAIYAMPRGD